MNVNLTALSKHHNISKNILYIVFSILFFSMCAVDEIIQENKIHELPKNSSILKKITVLVENKRLGPIQKWFSENHLKYYFYIFSFLYLWDVLIKYAVKRYPQYGSLILKGEVPYYANYILYSFDFCLGILPYAIISLMGADLGLAIDPTTWVHYIPSSILWALNYTGENLNDLPSLIHFVLITNLRLYAYHSTEKRKKYFSNILTTYVADTDLEAFKLLDSDQQIDFLDTLIKGNSLEKIERMMQTMEINFWARSIELLLKSNKGDDFTLRMLKQYIIKKADSFDFCLSKLFRCMCFLKEHGSRKELVDFYIKQYALLEQNDEISFFWKDFCQLFYNKRLPREINFYDDIYLVIKPFIEVFLAKIIHNEQVLHAVCSSISFFKNDEDNYDQVLSIYEDMFDLVIKFYNNLDVLGNENSNKLKPLETLILSHSSLAKQLYEYIIQKYNIDVKAYFDGSLIKMAKSNPRCFYFNNIKDAFFYMVRHKIDFETKDKHGNSVMHYMCQADTEDDNNKREITLLYELINILLSGGYKINFPNNSDIFPLDLVTNNALKDFLKSKGALSAEDKILLYINDFNNQQSTTQKLIIKKVIELTMQKDLTRKNIRDIFTQIYSNFTGSLFQLNNDHIIEYCMKYHLNDEIYPSLGNELSILQNGMVELCQNSIKYSINDVCGGNIPALYTDWLIKIVEKRSNLDDSINQQDVIDQVDAIFEWFLSSKFPCDFTRTCEVGHNIFHKISYGGLVYYFVPLIDTYKNSHQKNLYKALTQKGGNKRFPEEMSLSAPEVAQGQSKEFPDMQQYSNVYEHMEKTIKELEPYNVDK